MSDRRLVVGEFDSTDPDYGGLFAINPNRASSIPIPAFKIGVTKPATGSLIGEGFYERNARKAWVWDGTAWREVAANPILTYASQAALFADNAQAVGSYAITTDNGDLYVRKSSGWTFVGIKEYATIAQLLADTQQPGALGFALDEDSLWEWGSSGWRAVTARELADTAAVVAWAGANSYTGDRAFDLLHGVFYMRTGAGWRPVSLWEDTEANIRAATWPIDGQEAIATDTGRTFSRVAGAWVEEPIQHYATQAGLLAASVPDGTLAWADDTGNVFTRAGGAWSGLNTGMDDPIPVGALMDFPSRSVPNGWLECDGSAIPADAKYDDLRAFLGGTNLPDLRGLFARAAGATDTLLATVDWSTGLPKTSFTTNTAGAHVHDVNRSASQGTTDFTDWGATTVGRSSGGTSWGSTGNPGIQSGGDHSHTITGGGDAETAPAHYKVVRCIKAFHITQARPAPDTILSGIVAPAKGEALTFDLATSTWRNGINGDPPGTIVQSLLTEAQFIASVPAHQAGDWVLADGRDVTGSRYAQITGQTTVPDLRGAFIRAAGQNAAKSDWEGGTVGFHEDTTRRPRNTPLTGTASTENVNMRWRGSYSSDSAQSNADKGYVDDDINSGTGWLRTLSSHSHSVTITGGGDTETAPKHYSMNHFVKIN